MKKEQKDQLRKLSTKELLEKLQELETEKFKLVTKVKYAGGYPNEKMTYSQNKST